MMNKHGMIARMMLAATLLGKSAKEGKTPFVYKYAGEVDVWCDLLEIKFGAPEERVKYIRDWAILFGYEKGTMSYRTREMRGSLYADSLKAPLSEREWIHAAEQALEINEIIQVTNTVEA